MNLQSVKTRFIGSYLFLLILFVIQVPMVFVLVGGMTEKYSQIDTAGGLRKRAVEITDILSRHIMTGNEELEALFQKRKGEYQVVIDNFRKGTDTLAAIDNEEISAKLVVVEKKWADMRRALDETMVNGDNMREMKQKSEESTLPLLAGLDKLITAEKATKNSEITKFIDRTGLQKVKTAMLSYYMERYILATEDKPVIRRKIDKIITDFDTDFNELGAVVAINGKGVNNKKNHQCTEFGNQSLGFEKS